MTCRACSLAHPATERCEVARRRLANISAPMVVDTAPVVVVDTNNGSRHGKYADMDRRRQYQREWAARKRRAASA